jgi:hypothetical protein
MDIKKLALHRSVRRKRRKSDTAELAAQLAPLEELHSGTAVVPVGIDSPSGNGQGDPNSGAIIVDRDASHVPKDMLEGGDEKGFWGMEPVVLVILAIMLVFVAFVAWQISQMPAK